MACGNTGMGTSNSWARFYCNLPNSKLQISWKLTISESRVSLFENKYFRIILPIIEFRKTLY